MLQHMSCRMRRSAETSLGPGAQACSTSFLGQPLPSKRKSSLMRKQMELLRQGCKILRLHAEGHAHEYSSLASRSGCGSHLQSHAQWSGKANSGPDWRIRKIQARKFEEDRRSSSSRTLEGSTSHEAVKRAYPIDAAHPSGRPTSVSSAGLSKQDLGWSQAGVNGGSASHPAVADSTATQASSTEFQEAVQGTESEYDLHSPTVNHLAAMVRAQQQGQLVCFIKSLQERAWVFFSALFVWMASKVTSAGSVHPATSNA
jgi:hypothetical protein